MSFFKNCFCGNFSVKEEEEVSHSIQQPQSSRNRLANADDLASVRSTTETDLPIPETILTLPNSEVEDASPSVLSLKKFSLEELEFSTDRFLEDNKLGEGGFGYVYWGHLSDDSEIAVKRLRVWTQMAELEFIVEVQILGKLHHKHLLNLRGFCSEGEERLIVYDFMPHLSLFSHLHGKLAHDCLLDWSRRFRIILGTSEAVRYLHHFASPHVIHRDLKASNILLDDNFDARVSDFGFAKLVPDGSTHVTTRVKGTLGYLSPEYAMWGRASEKSDVYSFGILVLEIVTGRRPIRKQENGTVCTIVEWASPIIASHRFRDLVDEKLRGKFVEEEVKRCVLTALKCIRAEPDLRPSMIEVFQNLKKDSFGENFDTKQKIDNFVKSVFQEHKIYMDELFKIDDEEND